MPGSIEARLAKAEWRFRHRTQGVHRYTDEELEGLIAVLRQAEVGESIEPERAAWATALLIREGAVPGEPPPPNWL